MTTQTANTGTATGGAPARTAAERLRLFIQPVLVLIVAAAVVFWAFATWLIPVLVAALLIIGALFDRMAPVLWVIAVLSNITVIHRMIFTYQETKRLEEAQLRPVPARERV